MRPEITWSSAVVAAALVAGAGAGAAYLPGCLAPTEIVLHVSTNVACRDPSQYRGTSIFVGSTEDVESKAPALTTSTCQAGGQIGTLVIVPTGAENDEIGIRAVAGITRDPEDCASNRYQGCIVARRAIRFTPHATLDVYVALTNDCVGVSCDPQHTCVSGTCTDSRASQATAPAAEAGPVAATVRCGDNGARCPTSGNVCCLSVDTDAGVTYGECKDPSQCPPTSMVLRCDKESDCAGERDDAGMPNLCCLSYAACCSDSTYTPHTIAGTQCLSYQACLGVSGAADELCMDRQACVDGTKQCAIGETDPPGVMPGYFWCQIP